MRKERDEKQDAAREVRSNAAAEYMKAKKMIEEKEHTFKELQEQVLEAFIHQQLIDRKAYKLLLTAERTDACAKYDKAKHDEKIAKRRANEEYMDKVGIAFRYNKERVTAGEQPIYYEKSREILAEEHEAGYQEDGWPKDPEPEEAEA